ncbi:hypothetical protein EYF80_018667 [Liparis tanakae]|uniref:Uncharacterized protein n=1 Tax=Liparis tanakae TaxID=230148 RepID=A0A4Z2HZJ1_9TELE|nr:hypothetical protein EYF80_018667 [Liparis tanakae]
MTDLRVCRGNGFRKPGQVSYGASRRKQIAEIVPWGSTAEAPGRRCNQTVFTAVPPARIQRRGERAGGGRETHPNRRDKRLRKPLLAQRHTLHGCCVMAVPGASGLRF